MGIRSFRDHTEMEEEVRFGRAEGMTTKEIADRLEIAPGTVAVHEQGARATDMGNAATRAERAGE